MTKEIVGGSSRVDLNKDRVEAGRYSIIYADPPW